ncbi:hypothetical protein IEQ34_008042 [Dendrobium chrysotoxum]|uniref:Uncharacterized protein n=1 Tax=Dendrobium chrysotoxum TaxID=161865 RepID=A0AAV7H7G7_DENCH|nr:hypothetical protein IEQ34_008042 [Dendrobium chrysotoxum]
MSTPASGRSKNWRQFSYFELAESRRSATISHPSMIQAFRRGDFDGFALHVASYKVLRDMWKSANEGIEQLAFEARRVAE